jgi:hypothetical protein
VELQLLTAVQVTEDDVEVALAELDELDSSFLAHDPISATMPAINANQKKIFFITISLGLNYC